VKILFVCTGNTCRSSMAEALMKRLAAQSSESIEVRSAGIAAVEGEPASGHARTVMKELGLNLDDHRASGITREAVEWADLILTMTTGQRDAVVRRFPDAAPKTHVLKEYASTDVGGSDIQDPFLQPVEVYRKVAGEISEALSKVVEKIKGFGKG